MAYLRNPRLLARAAGLFLLASCAHPPDWLPTSGPSATVIEQSASDAAAPIAVIDISRAVIEKLRLNERSRTFAEFSSNQQVIPEYVIGSGDTIEVSIWEAPPATLFVTAANDTKTQSSGGRAITFPEQMVSSSGMITIPFAGEIHAAGNSLQKVSGAIAQKLAGKAHMPQVVTRITHNATSNVTVVGEVTQSQRVPLTPRGERLLDALAIAGGVKQPVGKTTIQLSRASEVVAMPLSTVIQDQKQNITLNPGDVITALYQPLSFTALGAANRNEEINFEAQGISLAQALGRIGGLQDARANATGLFVFRYEDGQVVDKTDPGKIPVVYRADMKDPQTFLLAQQFAVRDKDVIYIANADSAELQKFLNILATSVFTITAPLNAGINR